MSDNAVLVTSQWRDQDCLDLRRREPRARSGRRSSPRGAPARSTPARPRCWRLRHDGAGHQVAVFGEIQRPVG
ncbi:hypothetical protein TK78_00260 [Streptomyces sp. Tue 6075]|nr:hypothetical protein TK78_00260 [Streptomyces sp. Tue 6075]